MAVNTYECLFLVNPNKAAGDWQTVLEEINTLLARANAEILHSQPWAEQKLAYPIKRFRKGSYILSYFKADPARIVGFEQECRLTETIVRYMLVKLHPRIADEILTHLKSGAPPIRRYGDSEETQPAVAVTREA